MSQLLDWLITDPNVSPDLRRQFSDTPHAREVIAADLLERAKAKAGPRRFTGESPTGFGPLDDDKHP